MDPLAKRVAQRFLDEGLASRVVRRFLGADPADAKMQALLLKLRKGADTSITMKQLFAVLKYLGGWRVEEFNGFVKLHGYMGREDKPSNYDARDYERLKRDEVKALPSSSELHKHYTMDVTLHPQESGWEHATAREWLGREGVRFTSPEGKVFEYIPRESAANLDKTPFYEVRKWFREQTDFLKQVSNALGMQTHEVEQTIRKQPKTRSGAGTCPCCFRNIKLKDQSGQAPGIVLHGYERPGWGSIQGKCYGVGYPPFELAHTGTSHLVEKVLQPALKHHEEYLHRLTSGQVTKLHDTAGHSLKEMTPETEGQEAWDKLIKSRIDATEHQVKGLKHDIELLGKMISSWKEEPLPEVGERVKPPPAFLR